MSDLPAKRRTYTEQDKRKGLIALLTLGSSTRAAQHTGIPKSTLEHWRNTDIELWSKLNHDHGEMVDNAITAQLRESVMELGEIERDMRAKLADGIGHLQARDLPQAIAAVSKARAQTSQQLNTALGRASVIVETRDAKDLISDIAKEFAPYVNSTAEDA